MDLSASVAKLPRYVVELAAPYPTPPLAASVIGPMLTLRDATAADHAAYVRLLPELGVDDPTPSAQRFTENLAARSMVVVDGDTVVGFLLLEELGDVGYIRNLMTAPTHRRQGIGAKLMQAAHDRFERAGATHWCLNVKLDNAPAIAMYERFGMARAYTSTTLRFARDVPLIADPRLAIDELPPALDTALEARFAILTGQFASARAKDHQVLQLARGRDVVGVCSFSPTYPGGFPFKVEVAGAQTFVALLRPRITVDAAWVQFVVEDDVALAAEMARLGATVQLQFQHMRGALTRT